MSEDLTFYYKSRNNEPEYVISKPKSKSASDYFLFLPRKRSIESIPDALEYIKNNIDLQKTSKLPDHHMVILIEILSSIKRANLLDDILSSPQTGLSHMQKEIKKK